MTVYAPDEPRPNAATPLNDQVLSFGDDCGYTLDDTTHYPDETFGALCQRELVHRVMHTDMHGEFTSTTVGDCESRQNGKGEKWELIELSDALLLGGVCSRNAQLAATASDAQRRLKARIDSVPQLAKKLTSYKVGNNEKLIAFSTGGMISYSARTGQAGRGLTGVSRITYDEAQDLQEKHVQASSSSSAIPKHGYGRQVAFLGSAGMAHSVYWHDMRMRVLTGKKGKRMLWNEHTAQRFEGLDKFGEPILVNPDPEDRDAWLKANMALVQGRMRWSFLEDEWDILTPTAFATEHLGVWVPPPQRLQQGAKKIDLDAWKALQDPSSKIVGHQFIIAIAVDPEQANSAIWTAGQRFDDLAHVELVEHKPGIAWVAPFVRQMVSKRRPLRIYLDGSGAGKVLAEELREVCKGFKLDVRVLGKDAMSTASNLLTQKVKDNLLMHLGDATTINALATIKTVAYGESWRWYEEDGQSIAPVTGLSAAVLGFDSLPKRRSVYDDYYDTDDEEE